ncbi:hypothetical protein [Actinoplanes sp. NPDC049599]|uniref:hypothetical protein n=1 Tax=Actinoplanes sp. NPDC049599 TaxID=3363903 RepID=UPI00378C1887
MDRLINAACALLGAYAVVANRTFGQAGPANAKRHFGRDIPEGGREYRFLVAYGRTLAIVVGSLMLFFGTLGALGVDWRALLKMP